KHFLASVFSNLMMLAFLMDQVQGLCCQLFQQTQEKTERLRYFWHKVRSMFDWWLLPDWEILYGSIAYGIEAQVPRVNSS
ncbi:MAG: transposase, partial [Gammaproteobacteria bacterium]|nr:transposase [Gammaproteobacteria bacterium]